MSVDGLEPLCTVVTTDLCAITRGRPVPARALESAAVTGVGWVPANSSLTAFGSIADPNPWGSHGDLRLLPDLSARFRSGLTGAQTPFDIVCSDIVDLDGAPWPVCMRALLRTAANDVRTVTGLEVMASIEQEFTLLGLDGPPAQPFSVEALRRSGAFAPRVYAALADAGCEPEMVLAEYGADQFEVTCRPAPALAAADRAVAVREIVREIAREAKLRACFSPKVAPDTVGNGTHVHMSLRDGDGRPATYDPARPGGLAPLAAQVCGGILDHLPALVALSAPTPVSYLRLKPHNWSSAYTWLGDRDREATLRICRGPAFGGRDPAASFNVEYRAADATANPYLVLAGLLRAGLDGIATGRAAPPVVAGDPAAMSEAERRSLGLARLPETLERALTALQADAVISGAIAPIALETFLGIRRTEMALVQGLDDADLCARYKALY